MKPHFEEAWRLVRLADRDIQAFNVLNESSEVHISIVCFHAQQAVEKSLKAVLFARQIEFERIHDLVTLARILQEDGIMLPVVEDELRRLNPFAVAFRYDDLDINLISRADTERLVSRMRAWAEEQLTAAQQQPDDPGDDQPDD